MGTNATPRDTSFMESRPDKAKALMGKVRSILMDHHEGTIMEIAPPDANVLIVYSRIRSLLTGVTVLLDARLAEEAVILAREMFSDSLKLMAIAARGGDRESLVLGMINDSITDLENLERQDASLRPERQEERRRVAEIIAERRRQVDAYRQRRGIGKLERFGHEYQLARDLGRLDEYLDFELAHRFVHSATIAQAGRMKKQGDVVGVHLHNPSDDLVAAAAAFAMTSALHAHKAAASIFEWTETAPEDVDALLGEIAGLFPAVLPEASGPETTRPR